MIYNAVKIVDEQEYWQFPRYQICLTILSMLQNLKGACNKKLVFSF